MNVAAFPRQPPDILRVPPHSIDAEQAVLGALMLKPEALDSLDWLQAADFYRRDHAALFGAIREMADRKLTIDAVTVCDFIEAGDFGVEGSYVLDLAQTQASAANVVAYAEIVAEKSRLRRAIDIGTQLASAAFDGKRPSADVLANAHHAISEMQASGRVGGLMPVKPALRSMFKAMQDRYESGPGLIGLPTPWLDVNKLTKGLRPGVLYVVAGRPSMGKSIFAGQLCAFNASRGNRTAMFSVEMGADENMQRMVSSLGNVPHDWLDQPNNEEDDADLYWSRTSDAIARLADAPLLIDETPALKHGQLMARARREHRKQLLTLIVTDHLHDMGSDGKRAEEIRADIGAAVQAHKTLAKELRVPVVLMAQLNRNVASRSDKRPVMTDLRESGEIEQKADVILFLHREDYYDPENMPGAVELIPAKGRNLRIDKPITLRNAFDVMRLDDWSGPFPTRKAAPFRAGSGWTQGKEKAARNDD